MATEVNKELSSIVECCICTEIFTNPRVLPCIHTFCVKCLTETGLRAKKGPGDKMPCPLCRVEFVIPPGGFMGLQKNFFMDRIVNVVQLSSKHHVGLGLCESNKGDCSSVKWYCNECKQKLCSECSMINTKLHSVERHTLVPIENQNIDTKIRPTEIYASTLCDEHGREELQIFCKDCRVVLCALCFLESHQSHKWSQVKEVANKFKTQIESNIGTLSSCTPGVRSKLDQLEKDHIIFLDTISKVESEVNKKKFEVKALLNEIVEENANSLLLELTSLKRTTLKEKEIEREETDRLLTKLESHITCCSDIATKGSDVDICRSASELDNRAKELKELHGVALKQKSATFRVCFEERKPEECLKKFGNLLGKIQGAHPKMANSQYQQQSVMFNQQNPQVIMSGMPAYMPYMVRQGAMMSAQPPPTPQQSAAIRQMTMIPRFPSPMPPYQQHSQQQQQQQQQQTGFVQQEQPHYSMMPPYSNYHLTAAGMHPAYYQAMQVQQPVPQRSDGSNLLQLQPVWEAQLVDLLKQHKDNQPIFKWIQGNVTAAQLKTHEFIRTLVTAVCKLAVMASETSSNAQSASYSVSEAEIVSRQTLLQRYLDHKRNREIQALYALQALVHSLEHPSNILYSFFNILYDKEIIAEDAFWEWKNSFDPAEQNGRGVAFQSVRPFFEWLGEGTEKTTGS